MSSIKTTQIDGDVSVGRNVATGGKLTVAGNMSIGHNLKVEGWLEASNIKGANKGIFLTLDDLREAYPSPNDGWMAGIGSSSPFATYIGNGGDWVATGGTIEIDVDMTMYTKDIEQLQEDVIAANTGVSLNATDITSLRSDLSTEVEERKAADSTLQSNIDALAKSLQEGYLQFVDFANIDTVLGTTKQEVYEAIQVANGKRTLKYIVTANDQGKGKVFVGYLDMFADGMRHCLTQEFTTNYRIDANGKWDGSHDHKLHKYVRYYCLQWSGTDWRGDEWAQGTWTKWNSPTEDIESSIATLQTADDTLQGNITAIKNSVGKASGIAPLNEDGKVSSDYLPSDIGIKDVLEFGGFVINVNVVPAGISTYDVIVYDTSRNTFLAGVKKTFLEYAYYDIWGVGETSYEQYVTELDGAPYRQKLYVNTKNNSTYYYNGSTLVCVGTDNASDISNETDERKSADESIQGDITTINEKIAELEKQHDGSNAGFYTTEEALKDAYPNPAIGMMAFVGSGSTYIIYRCTTAGGWTKTEETYTIDVPIDLDDYTTKEEFNTEAEERKEADATLQSKIDDETTARTNADTNLAVNFNAEVTERKSADEVLQKKMDELDGILSVIKSGDQPLVTPTIKPSSEASYLWQVFNADGTSVATLTDKSINTIYGYKVNFIGSMSWSSADGYKNPTAMNGGDWSGVALPADGELSDAVKYSNIVADKTITASIKAPKQGLVYKNGIIKWADSADVSTASTYARVHFQYKVVATQVVSEVTQSTLQSLLSSTYALQDGRSKTLTGVITSSAQYYVYAYPSKLGKLTKIVMNDATPLLDGGFTLSTISVVDPMTKASVEYYVYTSVQKGAFTNVKLTIE